MKTIEHFLLELDGQQKAIVSYLHHRLVEYHGLRQDIKYEIPMYYRKSWVCYMNPIKKQGIELAFTKGNKLSNEQKILDQKNRKYIAGIDLYAISELPETTIDEVIQEALILDEHFPKLFTR